MDNSARAVPRCQQASEAEDAVQGAAPRADFWFQFMTAARKSAAAAVAEWRDQAAMLHWHGRVD